MAPAKATRDLLVLDTRAVVGTASQGREEGEEGVDVLS